MTRPEPRSKHPVRDKIRALPANASDRARKVARLRSNAVRDAVENAPTRDDEGIVQAVAPSGQNVRIERIELSPESAETAYIDVYLAGQPESGDVHYRIINPPTLVPDRAGPVDIGGVRYREDPLAAIAHVIASNGGAAL